MHPHFVPLFWCCSCSTGSQYPNSKVVAGAMYDTDMRPVSTYSAGGNLSVLNQKSNVTVGSRAYRNANVGKHAHSHVPGWRTSAALLQYILSLLTRFLHGIYILPCSCNTRLSAQCKTTASEPLYMLCVPQDVSPYPDYLSLHAVCDKRFAVIHYESPVPSGIELITLKQVGGLPFICVSWLCFTCSALLCVFELLQYEFQLSTQWSWYLKGPVAQAKEAFSCMFCHVKMRHVMPRHLLGSGG